MKGKKVPIEFSIRAAREGDADDVGALYSQMCPDVSNIDRDFRAILADPRAGCLILEAGSSPVGMIVWYVRSTLSSGRKMVIDELVIDHECRRQGLGMRLLDHCIGLAREQGLDSVEVGCSLVKTGLHRFYERAGLKHRMRLYAMLLN